MLQPQNAPKKYDHLFADIESGRMKIPKFQRDFVWTKVQTASLVDSIIKGFPIGTFIFWKTREEMRHFKDIGNIRLPDVPKGDAVLYVLDGQQRITSLYAVRKGARITKDGKEEDYKRISINLAVDPDEDEQVVTPEPPGNGAPYITVHKLLTGTIAELAKEYGDHLDRISTYQRRLTGYDFSTILIEEYPIDVACEVFTRINTGGTELTLFEIMVAKMFDQARDFDLAREYDRLLDSNGEEKDLEDVSFDTLPPATVLQCVAAHLSQRVRRKDVLKLDKTKFIEAWPTVKDGIFAAVDWVRGQLRIPVSRLLPYSSLLVPLTYFFIRNDGKPPSSRQNKLLVQYFFWAALSHRYTSGVENKLAQDLERMDRILKGELPSYHGEEVQVSLDDLKQCWFSTGDSFCLAILCLYAYHQPKSFADNSLVKLGNDWLKVAQSRNYHHFFPKKFLKSQGYEEWEANSILNITLVDAYLNKHRIRAKAPSDYIREFQKANDELEATMRSHLIGDLDAFGVWADDYPRFLEKRGQRVLAEIEKRLHPNVS